uniref:C1q domain-containing protein n=1 Tax=Sparus aurata TaxID=8175 RepID=A0A671VS32_SPAAU
LVPLQCLFHLGTGTSLAVCQPDTCALLSEVAAMREKMAATTQTQSRLEQTLSTVMQKMATLKALKDITSADTTKMAFTAALGSPIGPFQQSTPVKYPKILSNIGSGYNPNTGIFTARVRGVYYFRYTMYNNNSGQPNSVVALMMNSQRLVHTWDTTGSDNHDSASNAAVVQLEAGESVFVQLEATRVLYDDTNNYNTFSGFLLFTL